MQPRAGPQRSRWRRPQGSPHRENWADLWPVLPVGTGTAARSAAKGVYHAAVRTMLNAWVPAERRTIPELGVLLCRPPAAGCADQRSAFPCLPVAPLCWGSRAGLHLHSNWDGLERWPVLPVGASDRHRAGARNQRRCTTRSEITHRQLRESAGTGWSAGLRPASRGSAKPAPMTPRHTNVRAAHPVVISRLVRRTLDHLFQREVLEPPAGRAGIQGHAG